MAPSASPPAVPWRSWTTGMRVVVRCHLPEGGFTDVLGYILEITDDGLLIETRRGPVPVSGASIALGKPVPPPPPRRRPKYPPV